jgi:hypothetical protein
MKTAFDSSVMCPVMTVEIEKLREKLWKQAFGVYIGDRSMI